MMRYGNGEEYRRRLETLLHTPSDHAPPRGGVRRRRIRHVVDQ